jgi:DNA-binding protein YbaB
MFDDETQLDAAEQMIDDWADGFAKRAAQAKELSRRLGGLTVSASSDDAAVTVTVASSGALTDLRLLEKVKDQPAERIAAQILAVARSAQAELSRQVAAAIESTVGANSPTGKAVLASYARQTPPARPAGKGA